MGGKKIIAQVYYMRMRKINPFPHFYFLHPVSGVKKVIVVQGGWVASGR
jgi:hypothetical protein